MDDPLSKTHSTFAKKINRHKKRIEELTTINDLRKHQISMYNEFINKLIEEGRISKEEISEYMETKYESLKKYEQRKNS